MLKIKKIKLSGFRGILHPQELNLNVGGNKEPRSLILYGLNSSGKTSFVDGLEWFLSENNKIEWLRREEAEEKAYPHQAAKDKNIESFVEIEFYDTINTIGTLTKTYDNNAIKRPFLSDENDFRNIYTAFVIRPYFRYLEIVDFVVSTAGEKYKRLAQWMGFESELVFQEKIALDILQELKKYEKELSDKTGTFEQQLKQLINGSRAIEVEVSNFCNEILKQHKITVCRNVSEVWKKIPEITKLKSASSVGVTIDKLTKAETALTVFVLKEDLPDEVMKLKKKIEDFRKEKELVKQIDVIELYTQALGILTKQTEASTKCPVCGKEWEREKLIEHIKEELGLLKKTKENKEAIENDASLLKATVNREITSLKELVDRYGEIQSIISEIKYDNAKNYSDSLNELANALSRISADATTQIKIDKESFEKIGQEKDVVREQIKTRKSKIQPSKAEVKLAEDIEKLTQIKSSWQSLESAKTEQGFTTKEINKFYELKDELVRAVQENIESRFKETSDSIGKYFGILRNDKDIRDIKIELNKEKGKAAGRSAEIQLTYYNISVKPAYKVLSESLLNSLGLAVYFTCVKQFNGECKFIVLDDIMNSLDIDKRDTLLDLIQQELPDYQIILFTHDYYWFNKIIRRFPDWISKKIKGWDYIGGAKIDAITTTKDEIEEYLTDATKTEAAGWLLGRYVESILNELCEKLWVEVRYRYTKNDPPTMEELFDALRKRLKSRVKTHPIVEKVLETKKHEPILRNFVSHARSNQPASVSPAEIRRATDEWFSLEVEFWCDKCNHFVEYHKSKDVIECKCGKKKLEAPKVINT